MRLVFISLIILAGSLRAELSRDDPHTASALAFFMNLKGAVVKNDKTWISDHISYPIVCYVGSEFTLIDNQDDFLNHFEDIINERVVSGILNQKNDELHRSNYGIRIGRVWIDSRSVWDEQNKRYEFRGFKIVTINNQKEGVIDPSRIVEFVEG